MTTTVYSIPGYPAIYVAEDGTRVTIRPMVPTDKDALLNFFRMIPEEDRSYLKDDVTSPQVIEQWVHGLDYNRVLPLLAFDEARVIADGTLHHRRAGARRHLGEGRIVVDPAYRDRGVGRGLLHKLAEIAMERDIERLLFEIVADKQEAARHAALLVGFVPVAVLADHVRDLDGKPHDLVLLELNIKQQFPPLPNVF